MTLTLLGSGLAGPMAASASGKTENRIELPSGQRAAATWRCVGAAASCEARHVGKMRYARGAGDNSGTGPGRLAQRESASFTPRRSLVRSQYRPPETSYSKPGPYAPGR